MNKNSYVTAALFVVFVLLTVFYISIGDSNDSTTNKDGVRHQRYHKQI